MTAGTPAGTDRLTELSDALERQRAALVARDAEALRASMLDRGATQIGAGRQGPHTWVVLADPEGNEFCI